MNAGWEPAYLRLGVGEVIERARKALRHSSKCDLCARGCYADRGVAGGPCHTGSKARLYSYGPHHGEEGPISGTSGSGTLFFSGCNLECVFCQNWEISHGGEGRETASGDLAQIMLDLQRMGCHNINLVSPSHVVAPVLVALSEAIGKGLRIPVIYNSGGYDSPRALALLDGIVDIYMPDMKFADSSVARPWVGVNDYAEVNREVVREMHRQVGDLTMDDGGIARRGLLVRHLILPENAAGTETVLSFLAREISPDTYLNLMDQYRPCYRADEFPPLDRRPTRAEFRSAVATARALGLRRLDRS